MFLFVVVFWSFLAVNVVVKLYVGNGIRVLVVGCIINICFMKW